MGKKITTVCGDIAPEKLGVTSLHEHTFLDLRIAKTFLKRYFAKVPASMLEFKPENYAFLKSGVYLVSDECAVVDDMDFLVKEYGFFRADGGASVCDCSPIGCRGDVKKIRALSEKTGLNIICATGVYTMTSRPPELQGKDEAFYYETFRHEVEDGIDGTDIHPGLLKAAIATYGPDRKIMDGEIAGVRACARLSAETGLSVHIHTDPMISGEDVIRVAKMAIDCGAAPDKVHICHMDSRIAKDVTVCDYLTRPEVDRTLNLDTQKALLDMGVTIGLDTWGMPITNNNFFVPDDFERLKALITLLDQGYGDQITLGCDFSSKIMGRTYGCYGCTRTLEFAVPMLRQYGYESYIPKLLVDNPARILAY
ncbi:MAG: phosphotriesterase [Lachnospiraceae bacterium]